MTALYLARTYDEAFDLLVEARGFAVHARASRRQVDYPQRLVQVRESLRLTSRLTQIVAWLLAQKAYQAGELSHEDIATEDFRLAGGGVCLNWQAGTDPALPPPLTSLLRRSYDLYCRVRRLDQQFISDEKK